MLACLIEIQQERQGLLLQQSKITERLFALDQKEHEILMGKVPTDEQIVDFSMFSDSTKRLMDEFWVAPGKMLSHQDIREDVIFDEDAKESAIHDVIKAARKELKTCCNCHYAIENIRGKGYRLVTKQVGEVRRSQE